MVRTQLTRRLKATDRPIVWRSTIAACRAIRVVSPNRRLWTARLGYALQRAGRVRQAEAAYVEAIRGDRVDKDWREAARPAGAAGVDRVVPAMWYYRLGMCLRKRGDFAGAADALWAACDLDGTNPRWFQLLGDLEYGHGRRPAAIVAYERLAGFQGCDPELRLMVATAHDDVGQWDRAQRVLMINVKEHPTHLESHRLLATVSKKISQWGGVFTETLHNRADGRFRFGPSGEGTPTSEGASTSDADPSAVARAALERVVELGLRKPTVRVALADARLADGDVPAAIEQYEAALRAAARSTGSWVLRAKHRWQFQLESIYHQVGQARVDDPLFECQVEPAQSTLSGTRRIPGLFVARMGFAGLGIAGTVLSEGYESAEILLDGRPLRTVNLSRDGFFLRFSLTVKRKTLEMFPTYGEIEVRVPDGDRLYGPGGAERFHVSVPHGDGRLLNALAAGERLDKKGMITPAQAEIRFRQQRYLEIYSQVRDFFESHLDRPLFLMYGTLLGFYRDGDFIPGDDDFDAGYVSDMTDPVSVKEETKSLILELVRAGFTVSFNRLGRLFRVLDERKATDGHHVDLRPIWFQDGKVWAHNNASHPSTRQDFLPVVEGELRGVRVSVPRRPETFLRAHYGPGWKVPDPGFQYYPSDLDPAVRDNLATGLITVSEYKELAERIRQEVGESPKIERFVSIGSQDLYPVDHFID